MKIILKSLGLLILGILIGSFINMGFIIIGDLIFIKPEDFNPFNAMNWDIKYFIFPFIAHAFGTFSGSYSASKLSNNDNKTIPVLMIFFPFRRYIYGFDSASSKLVFILRPYCSLYSNGNFRVESW